MITLLTGSIFTPQIGLDGSKGKRTPQRLGRRSLIWSPTQLNNFDYSPTMARFKIIQLMKDAGIRGARNGRDTYNPEALPILFTQRSNQPRGKSCETLKTIMKPDERFEFRYDTAGGNN